jgi:hypothetical protein
MPPLNVATATNSRPSPQTPLKAITLPFRDTPHESRKLENEIDGNARATESSIQDQEVEDNGCNVNPQAFSQNTLLPMRRDALDKDGQDPNSRQATTYEFGESTAVPSVLVDSTPLLGIDSRSKELGHTTGLPLEIEESFSDLVVSLRNAYCCTKLYANFSIKGRQ